MRNAWYDFWRNPAHRGRKLAVDVKAGVNHLVVSVDGGKYPGDGFYAYCGSPGIGTGGREARKPRLLYSQAHGEWKLTPQLPKLAESLGVDFATSNQPLTADTLRDVNVLYVLGPTRPLADAEKKAVVDFVRGGGSLWLSLDEERRQSLVRTGVNDLIAPFGLKLTADTPYLHNRGAVAPKGAITKERREIPYSGGRTVTGGTPFSFLLDRKGQLTKLPHAAYAETPQGARIVVFAEGMAAIFMGRKDGIRLVRGRYWGRDSAVFNREVLEWLTAPSRRNGTRQSSSTTRNAG
ncbi:MAG: hypothetical protein ACYTGB_16340, partial [Planctomycetota bacterium]|jgi:hypothetical protein